MEFSRFDGVNFPFVSSTSAVNDGAYHFIAAVKDGGTLSIYVDGVLEGSAPDTTVGLTTNAQNIRFGIGDSFTPQALTGLIDDVRMYDVQVCASDVPLIMSEP